MSTFTSGCKVIAVVLAICSLTVVWYTTESWFLIALCSSWFFGMFALWKYHDKAE